MAKGLAKMIESDYMKVAKMLAIVLAILVGLVVVSTLTGVGHGIVAALLQVPAQAGAAADSVISTAASAVSGGLRAAGGLVDRTGGAISAGGAELASAVRHRVE